MFNIYLPIADMSINFFLVIGIGGMVGFLSGLFGVGGGFLLTPLMMMIGIPPAVAAASDSNQIVASSASGAFGHYRLGNVDMKMGLIILAGGVSGGTVGVHLVHYLRAMGNFEFVMKLVYVIMLGTIGGSMFVESLRAIRKSQATEGRMRGRRQDGPDREENHGHDHDRPPVLRTGRQRERRLRRRLPRRPPRPTGRSDASPPAAP